MVKDIFNFGGFIKNTNKKREETAEGTPSVKDSPKEDKAESSTMSQGDFSYGTTGMVRKKRGTPPASMNP